MFLKYPSILESQAWSSERSGRFGTDAQTTGEKCFVPHRTKMVVCNALLVCSATTRHDTNPGSKLDNPTIVTSKLFKFHNNRSINPI
jgi:hypothetical protein